MSEKEKKAALERGWDSPKLKRSFEESTRVHGDAVAMNRSADLRWELQIQAKRTRMVAHRDGSDVQLSFRISAEDAVILDRSLKILGMPTRTACAKFLLERAIAVLADEFDLLVPAIDPEENEPEDEP